MQVNGTHLPKRVVACVALCIVVTALWPWSHFRRNYIGLKLIGDQVVWVESAHGEIGVGTFPPSEAQGKLTPVFELRQVPAAHDPCSLSSNRTGFNLSTHYRYENLVVPYWFLSIIAAALAGSGWRLRNIPMRFSVLTMLTSVAYMALVVMLVRFLGYY